MKKTTLLLSTLGTIALSGLAGAQTVATTDGTPVTTNVTTTTTTPTTTITATTTPTSPTAGAYQQLSPGNRSIVDALYQSQTTTAAPTGTTATGTTTTGTTSTGTTTVIGTAPTLTRDQIAAMKGTDGGWGRVFQDMKANGYTDAKNLGEVVSSYHHDVNAERKGGETTSGTQTTATTSAKSGSSGRFVRDGDVSITTAGGGSDLVGRGTSGSSGHSGGSAVSGSSVAHGSGITSAGAHGNGGGGNAGGKGQGKH